MHRNQYRSCRHQRGLTTVEFSIVGLVFFTVLFMVFEFGRLMFTWNVLDEVTRRGARLAAVCPVTAPEPIRASAIMGGSLTPGLTTANVQIQYLNQAGNPINPVAQFVQVRFVRVRINGYNYTTFFPINTLLPAPAFETTIPAESLGISPPGTGVTSC